MLYLFDHHLFSRGVRVFIQTVRLYVECVVYQKNRLFFSFRQCDSKLNVLCTKRTDLFFHSDSATLC